MFDECHLIYSHRLFRYSGFQNLSPLFNRFAGTPKLFLTATLSIAKQQEFCDLVAIDCGAGNKVWPTILRHGSVPPNLFFQVIHTKSREDCYTKAIAALQSRLHKDQNQHQFMIFFLQIDYLKHFYNLMEKIDRNLHQQSSLSHGDLGPVDAARHRTDWRSGKTRIMLATTVMSCGVNNTNVASVFVLGGCYDIESVMQITGRAGRKSNMRGYGIFFTYPEFLECDRSDKDVCNFLTTQSCRVQVLERLLNGTVYFCSPDRIGCDNCHSRYKATEQAMIHQEVTVHTYCRDPNESMRLVKDFMAKWPKLCIACWVDNMGKPDNIKCRGNCRHRCPVCFSSAHARCLVDFKTKHVGQGFCSKCLLLSTLHDGLPMGRDCSIEPTEFVTKLGWLLHWKGQLNYYAQLAKLTDPPQQPSLLQAWLHNNDSPNHHPRAIIIAAKYITQKTSVPEFR